MDPSTHERLRSLLHPGRLPGDRRIDAADRNAIAAALEEIHRLRRELDRLAGFRSDVGSLSQELARLIRDA